MVQGSEPIILTRETVNMLSKRLVRAWLGFCFMSLGMEVNAQTKALPQALPPGMVLIPGGEFMMGSDAEDARPDEKPSHKVKVSPFLMDATEVTNAEFRAFVNATGYVTTAEKTPSKEEIMAQLPPGSPAPPDELFTPGSLVFVTPGNPAEYWWKWTPGANWKHPHGPDSSIDGKDDYPVVQVSWLDAEAYAQWAGKRLPTEAEWEFAARGGLKGKIYAWGDKDPYQGAAPANIWQGQFPRQDTGADGFKGASPIKRFKPNGYGLFDMTGNVWEWIADWYRHDAYAQLTAGKRPIIDPKGPIDSFDPEEPYSKKRVQRGGSFLCDQSFCRSYRVSARMKSSPDTGLEHTGFRCVKSLAASETQKTDALPKDRK